MKLISSCILLLLPLFVFAQGRKTDPADLSKAEKMFQSSKGIDITVYGDYDKRDYKYHQSGDSLTVWAQDWARKNYKMPGTPVETHIALADIDWANSKVESSEDHEKSKERIVYHLRLKAAEGKSFKTLYIFDKEPPNEGTADEADLAFENEAVANAALEFISGKASMQVVDAPIRVSESKTTTLSDELCEGIKRFVDDMQRKNFNGYVGELIEKKSYYGIDLSEYACNYPMPGDCRTTMRDSNKLQKRREAKVRFAKEQFSSKQLSEGMKESYAKLCDVVQDCLAAKGFSEFRSTKQSGTILIDRVIRQLERKEDDDSPFTVLQTGPTKMVVEIYVMQEVDKTNGSVTNELMMEVKME